MKMDSISWINAAFQVGGLYGSLEGLEQFLRNEEEHELITIRTEGRRK